MNEGKTHIGMNAFCDVVEKEFLRCIPHQADKREDLTVTVCGLSSGGQNQMNQTMSSSQTSKSTKLA
jgi:hypothetical protein